MKSVSSPLLPLMALVVAITFGAESLLMADESHRIPLGKDLALVFVVAPFDSTQHELTKCKGPDWTSVCLIDGKPVFGTDWDIPRNQLIKASVKVDADTVDLDVSCMYNPWFTKPDPRDFGGEKVEGGYRIRGFFSDGAGSYNAEWLVIKNSSVRTRLETAAE